MARVYDITNQLSNERPILRIGDREFEINNHYKNAMIIEGLVRNIDENEENAEKIILRAIGQEGCNYVTNELNLSYEGLITVLKAIAASLSGVSLEEVDKRAEEMEKNL